MPLHINILTLMLLCSSLLIPVTYVMIGYLRAASIDETLKTALRYWLYFLLSIFILRTLVGVLLLCVDIDLPGVGKFYPIRIASPNVHLFQGLPYIVLCLALLVWLERIKDFIVRSRLKYILIWGLSALIMLSFGGIHGGLVSGNAWMADAHEHLADASLNTTVSDTFITHTDRVAGRIKPSYQAPHSTSHPAASIAYWQVLIHYTSPFIFALINVLLFALAFPIIYWALRQRFDSLTAIQAVIVSLLIPSLLIYGRSDDAVYYAFSGIIIALVSIAIQEKRYALTTGAGGLLAGAMNLSYASVVLFPAMFAFNANIRLGQVWRYIYKVIPHALILLFIATLAMVVEARMTGFNWYDAFKASVHFNHTSTFISMVSRGLYIRAFNDRIMAICDFLIFAGPLFFYFFVQLIQNRKNRADWQVKNLALLLLFCVMAINSNGPGEVARPWGSLFLIIGFFWLPEFLNQLSEKTRWLLIRAQLAWALLLQITLNFGW